MSKKIVLTIAQSKVLSAFFTNLSAAWFFALFATDNPFVLTINLFFGTLTLHIAFRIEAKIT